MTGNKKNYPASRVLHERRCKFRKPKGEHLQSLLDRDWIDKNRKAGVSVGLWRRSVQEMSWRRAEWQRAREDAWLARKDSFGNTLGKKDKQPRKVKPPRQSVYDLTLIPLEKLTRSAGYADVCRDAVDLARFLTEDLKRTGDLRNMTPADPCLEVSGRWVEVCATLALQPFELQTPSGQVLDFGGIDGAWRYLATGLSSGPRQSSTGQGFAGWRSKLGIDPLFALREKFLISMRRGWGVHGRNRWDTWPEWRKNR
jgi:hypothetical protein